MVTVLPPAPPVYSTPPAIVYRFPLDSDLALGTADQISDLQAYHDEQDALADEAYHAMIDARADEAADELGCIERVA